MYLLLLHLSICLWTAKAYFGHVLFMQCSWGAWVNFRECCNASNLHLTGGFAACQQPHERVLSLTDILRCLELSPLLRQYKGICEGLICALTPSSKQHFLCLEVNVITQRNIYKEKPNLYQWTFRVSVRLIIIALLSWRYLWKFQIVAISRETLSPGCHNQERIITGWHAVLLSEGFLEQYVANSNSQKGPI